MDFKPKIIVFCCNWCSYAGADLAGVSRLQMKPYFTVVRTMCSGRVDPELVIDAFSKNADGILIAGCHPGDCHYINGNFKTRRRHILLKQMMTQLGINPQRLRLEWISAGEGQRFQQTLNDFIDELFKLGPIKCK